VKLESGHNVDRYVVESHLGQGGMASVYLVRHTSLGTLHALKVLDQASSELRERLLREGRVQANLRHENVVSVSDVLDLRGAPGLLMEYVDGGDLGSWLDREPLILEERVALFRDIVAGVAAAHAVGIVHRDLKPANVLMAKSDSGWIPKVTDFGLAKPTGRNEDESGITRTGAQMGTPAYMAPEQVRNSKDVDHRADLFALGCILYELVCGVRPFKGQDTYEVFRGIVEGEYLNPRELSDELPEALVNAIQGCLLPDLEVRIPSCERLVAVLDGNETWPIPESRSVEKTFMMDADDEKEEVRERAPVAPDSIDTLSPLEQNTPDRGHWILLSVVFMLMLLGVWWVKRGATIERPRMYPTDELLAVEEAQADSLNLEAAESVKAQEVVPVEQETEKPPEPSPVEVAVPVEKTPKFDTGFRVLGGHEVALTKPGVRYPPGPVPVGTYAIRVRFDDGPPLYGGRASIGAGEVIVISCDASSQSCLKVSP